MVLTAQAILALHIHSVSHSQEKLSLAKVLEAGYHTIKK